MKKGAERHEMPQIRLLSGTVIDYNPPDALGVCLIAHLTPGGSVSDVYP